MNEYLSTAEHFCRYAKAGQGIPVSLNPMQSWLDLSFAQQKWWSRHKDGNYFTYYSPQTKNDSFYFCQNAISGVDIPLGFCAIETWAKLTEVEKNVWRRNKNL